MVALQDAEKGYYTRNFFSNLRRNGVALQVAEKVVSRNRALMANVVCFVVFLHTQKKTRSVSYLQERQFLAKKKIIPIQGRLNDRVIFIDPRKIGAFTR